MQFHTRLFANNRFRKFVSTESVSIRAKPSTYYWPNFIHFVDEPPNELNEGPFDEE